MGAVDAAPRHAGDGKPVGFTPEATNTAAVASSVGRNYDPSFDWDGLKAMRDAWPRKLIVKGVVRPDDAERAPWPWAAMPSSCPTMAAGSSTAASPRSMRCPASPRAVGGRVPVLVDGGVRRGVDVVKALALGAEAVLVGRATLFGACAGGEAGAARAVAILREEFVRAMQLCGARTVPEIGADLLAPPR